jgi:excinuclease ABC subunit C
MSLDDKLDMLPTKPGIYQFIGQKGQILYVGKAKNIRNRVKSYFQKSRSLDPRLMIMVKKISDLEFIITDSDVEALILEANLIREHKPRYNINLKDDKSFPYIRITAEDFPQVFPTRRMIKDGSSYFGPYTNVKEMRNALATLKRLFSIRSCKYNLTPDVVEKKKVALCLDYYIKKCKGPCQGLQKKDAYQEMIEQVKEFLRGKTSRLQIELDKEMQELSESQKYEDAARIRDKIDILEKYRNSQKMVMSDAKDRDIFAMAREDDDACAVIFKIREGKVINRVHYYLGGVLHKKPDELLEQFLNQYYTRTEELPHEILLIEQIAHQDIIEKWLSFRANRPVKIVNPKTGEKKNLLKMCAKNAHYLLEELKLQKMKTRNFVPHVLNALQRDLHLSKPPRRIECFDISNIQGTDPVASMVCFIDGRPRRSEYRKFAIRSKSTPDDFAMMREVIQRRYSRLLSEKKDLPDLIVIDGGKGQLSSARGVLNKLHVQDQPIIGLAKRLEEIFFPGHPEAQILPKTSSSIKLLQQIRNEAHRFAITFHRQKRKKRTITSTLDQIPGIGSKRRNELLKKFGSVKKIKELELADLTQKGGLPEQIAINLYNFFRINEKNIENTE